MKPDTSKWKGRHSRIPQNVPFTNSFADSWTVPKSKSRLFHTLGTAFYRMLHKHITQGGPLVVTPDQVRQQIAVIEECHRQNPHIWGKKRTRRK